MEVKYDFEVKVRYKGVMELTKEEHDYYLKIEDGYDKALFVVDRADLTEIYDLNNPIVREFETITGE
jgi:hypothetical protein